jgi:2-polyprenyl-3-methyl-5-hydroxy-6-metoxy-1,4-benzoquinol methylase
MNEEFLNQVGLGHYECKDFNPEKVTLRKGDSAIIWVHKPTGHGVLDVESWVKEDYYSADYRDEFSGNSTGKKVESKKHLKMYEQLNERQFSQFKDCLSKEAKFLEIGGSFGGITNNVLGHGVKLCHIVEPNIEDASFLTEQFPSVRVYNSILEDANLESNFYDVAVSFEVLEHIVNPRAFLLKAAASLKEDGIIHLEVPNHQDVLLSCYNKDVGFNKFYYHKAHIHYFTPASLKELCGLCGFEGDVSSFLMYPFFNHVYWHFNQAPQLTGTEALCLPKPTEGQTEIEQKINLFYKRVESEYEKLINDHMVGDCLTYQGRKKR